MKEETKIIVMIIASIVLLNLSVVLFGLHGLSLREFIRFTLGV